MDNFGKEEARVLAGTCILGLLLFDDVVCLR